MKSSILLPASHSGNVWPFLWDLHGECRISYRETQEHAHFIRGEWTSEDNTLTGRAPSGSPHMHKYTHAVFVSNISACSRKQRCVAWLWYYLSNKLPYILAELSWVRLCGCVWVRQKQRRRKKYMNCFFCAADPMWAYVSVHAWGAIEYTRA